MSSKETDYWVLQAPVISSEHLTENVAQELRDLLPGEDFYGFLAAVTPFGGFIAIDGWDSEIEGYIVPECLKDVCRWVEAEGFDWVRLDAEGAKISCLALYAWIDD